MNGFQYKHGDRPLEGYTIQRAVGRGGFGEVYFAVSDSGREVALKAIQGYEQIELRGVSQCMNLKSPHLVTIFDVKHSEDGRPFVIMEYVSGPSLKDLIEQSPAGLGTQKSAFFLREIAKGLTYLHERGIVHRDLKPGNIFYEDGYVKIGDYGLSKAMSASRYSGQTITVGTVHYMAPEIGQGRYDCGVDIYALGCCLYEMLTGNVPFFGSSHGEILMKHMMAEPDLSCIEEPFATAIKRALAKDPKDRFQSAQEMVEAVYGAEHVRNSVSCFSPDSLSMVAARVAQKVAVGGSGSSADAVGIGPPPPVPPAPGGSDPWVNLAQRFDRFGRRITERVNQRMDHLRERLGGYAGHLPPTEPGATPGPAPEVTDSEVVFADPKRDPLNELQRGLLALITIAASGAAAAVVGFGRNAAPDQVLMFALLTAFGGFAGISLARKQFGAWLRQERGFVPRLIYGGMGCLLALPCVQIVMASFHRPFFDGDTRSGTLIALTVAAFIMDWRGRTSPGRKERVVLGQAFTAGLVGWVLCLLTDGAGLMTAAILAGVSMATQVAAPFDPQAVRRPRLPGERPGRWRRHAAPEGSAMPPDVARVPAAGGATPPARGGAPRQQTRPAGAPAFTHSTAGSRRPQYLMPGWGRGVFLGLFALLAGTGIMLLAWVGMSRGLSNDEETIGVACGMGALGFALFFLFRAVRRTYRGPWSSIVKPILMLLLALTAAISLTVMANARLSDDETLIALAFIIFPGILLVVLMFITDRMVYGTMSEIGLAAIPPAYNPSLPVSPCKRWLALVLTLPGLFPFPVAGIHRFYVGKVGTGFLWLFTCGLLGVGTLIDLIMIALGRFRDKEGKWVVSWDGASTAGAFPVAAAPGVETGVGPGAAMAGPATPVVPMTPVAPTPAPAGEAVTASLPGPVAPPFVPEPTAWAPPRRPRRVWQTNRVLNGLGGLIVTAGFLAGLALTVMPGLTAAGLPEPHMAQDLRDLLGERWPELLTRLGTFLAAAAMTVGLTIMIIARRYAGAGHCGRAVLGTIGLGLCVTVLHQALTRIDWSEVVALSREKAPGPMIEYLTGMIVAPALISSGVLLLLAVVLLVWPERRPRLESSDFVAGGAQ